ncbi:rhodanese-like domain-containing protein [Candidatus Woesearchaeota archaeon]|jgi:rhodanese-related sulfurtransferase|nr:rhodanese-like domain-containing protein [Candidatus Woesearchaeota archaeon]MBT4387876.1 rhodanese-like domain-containing protein [Candidatus Woesearchaeota archaeon]MBT4595695.1 rhodanese-like domain-containing protein [Candidatus Woesearchaeota archaeon]MBT5741456.1 rhodanese-like domain-containing protein [Candidatus Woesearchaeota archaeon]MBT6505714.1 rhodanese-like domain-containing protein [Candidatus Woesearchaeota archaeon]
MNLLKPNDIANKSEFILIDVRSPAEFESEHISNSINIPLEYIEKINSVIENKNVVIICKSGMRSNMACQKLSKKDINILQGGIENWKKEYKTIVGTQKWDIQRQVRFVAGSFVLIGSLLTFLNKWFIIIPIFFGAGLTFSAITNSCTMGLLLSKLPYNKLNYNLEKEINKI